MVTASAHEGGEPLADTTIKPDVPNALQATAAFGQSFSLSPLGPRCPRRAR
jgi:hypothetical protein